MITKRRGTIFFGLLFVVIVLIFSADFLSDRVFCYDTNVAHPQIAQMAVELYNRNFDPDLSAKDLECILSGAREEDTPTRWLNHFFDPIHNRGLKGINLSAKNWAANPSAQASFALGDQSWQRALQDYQDGKREQALLELGHVLHLVADMAVPAHTRDDIHVYPGDSFEQYLKNNWAKVASGIDIEVMRPKNVLTLNSAFDELASYSNNNFYSDDTIEDKNFKILKIESTMTEKVGGIDYEFYENFLLNNGKNILFSKEVYFDWYDSFSLFKKMGKASINSPVILNNHAQLLVPKAVSYSAGVIKLFFGEVGKLSKTEKQNLPLFRQNLNGLGDLILGKVISGGESLMNRFKSEDSKVVYGDEISKIVGEEEKDIELENKIDYLTPAPLLIKEREIESEVLVPTVSPVVPPGPTPVVTPIITPAPAVDDYGGEGGGSASPPQGDVESVTSTLPTETPTSTVTSTIPIETPTSTPTSTFPIETPTSTPTSTTPIETPTTTPTSTLPIETPTSTPTTTLPIETVSSSIVVINEIAWSGTGPKTANDEWLELYNNTTETIDLTGWSLNFSGRIINLSGSILAHNYYLMERTSDKTVDGIEADLVFSLSNGLSNNGEKLVLKNNNNEIIDEVDCTTKWFAGTDGSPSLSQDRYRTMERINTLTSGNVISNWRNNIGVPVILGKNNFGGGEILGTPRQSNNNFWVLKNLTYNYSGQIFDNVFHLTKEHGPYLFDNNFQIPSGYTVIVEPGVVLTGLYNFSYINVLGELQINGTEEKPVIFTSARDGARLGGVISGWTGDAISGDWSRIEVNAGGKLKVGWTNFYYGGNTFKKGTGWVYGTESISQVIRNTGGNIEITNSSFHDSFVSPIDQQYSAIIWTENLANSSATSSIKNNNFDGGLVAIKNYGQNNGTEIYSEISENTFNNFSGSDGPVVSKYFLPNFDKNIFSGNNKDSIYLDCVETTGDITLEKGDYIVNGAITVHPNDTLTLSSGSNFIMKNSSDIIVDGTLFINGMESEPVNFNPELDYAWGKINFRPNSAGVLNYAFLYNGGMTSEHTSISGMIMANQAVINLNNILLSDGQRPQNMVYLKNSNTKIKDSRIAWSTERVVPNREICGITAESGTLDLDNVYFDQMDIGVNSLNAMVFKTNMEDGHFTNIKKYNWWPEDLFVPIEVLEQG